MDQNKDVIYMRGVAKGYKEDLLPLLRYLPYLEERSGFDPSTNYEGQENGNSTLCFPIFDSTLLAFVKEAGQTSFMDNNYSYVYSRNRINTPDDERKLIETATINEWGNLCGILTRYVRGGMTKAYLWRDAMRESIFLLVLCKMKEIVEFWDKPV